MRPTALEREAHLLLRAKQRDVMGNLRACKGSLWHRESIWMSRNRDSCRRSDNYAASIARAGAKCSRGADELGHHQSRSLDQASVLRNPHQNMIVKYTW